METSVPPGFGKETLAGLSLPVFAFPFTVPSAPKGAIDMGSYGIAKAMPFQNVGDLRRRETVPSQNIEGLAALRELWLSKSLAQVLNRARQAINRNKRKEEPWHAAD
jgi:hypothetical protein